MNDYMFVYTKYNDVAKSGLSLIKTFAAFEFVFLFISLVDVCQ